MPSHAPASPDLYASEQDALLPPILSRAASSLSPANLRRKSAKVSDLLSHRSHSGYGTIKDEDEQSDGSPTSGQGGYDGDRRIREELVQSSSGVRDWYSNFTSVDWLHDSIKEHARLRFLRGQRGVRGRIANILDSLSGWLLITLIAIVTAVIAALIVTGEAWLFDIKEGYCKTDWRRPKRFCCPPSRAPSAPFITTWRVASDDECLDFRTWSEVLEESTVSDWHLDWLIWIVLAVLFASLSSVMTVYLTASTAVYSAKDAVNGSTPVPAFDSVTPSLSRVQSRRSTRSYFSTATDGSDLKATLDEHIPPVPSRRRLMYYAAGSGIPEIKCVLSGFVLRGYLGGWTLLVKSVGLVLSVASGLSLGKEGPLVHVASCVANILSRFFKRFDQNEGKRREIISSACAAGVAVAFGSPLGGVLFSLEEVSYFFPARVMVQSFFCALIAAASLKAINPFHSGKIVLFEVTYDRDTRAWELLGFALLGIAGGVYGALFCKANIWYSKHIRRGTALRSHPILEVALVAMLTAIVSYFNPWTKMGGTELVSELFRECHLDLTSPLCITEASRTKALVFSLISAMIVKIGLTVITFGLRCPAGIFIPTLAVGALLGRVAGLLIEYLYLQFPHSPLFATCQLNELQHFGQACVLPGVWAMVGAAAALAGVTRMSISLAVIIMELTSSLTYVLPVMLTILVAKNVADAIESRSIYDLTIELNELPFLDAKLEYLHTGVTVADVVDTEAPTISLGDDNTLGSLRALLARTESSALAGGFPVLSTDRDGKRLRAYIAIKELASGLASVEHRDDLTPCTFASSPMDASVMSARTPGHCDFGFLSDRAPISLSIRSPLEVVQEMFTKLGLLYLVIVDEQGLYQGTIERNRWLAYLSWLEKNSSARSTDIGSP